MCQQCVCAVLIRFLVGAGETGELAAEGQDANQGEVAPSGDGEGGAVGDTGDPANEGQGGEAAPSGEGDGESVEEGGTTAPAREGDEAAASGGEEEGGEEAPNGEGGDAGGVAPAELNAERLEAATKIQSIARGKASRERVQRIKMGDEDAFTESGDKVRKAKKSADGVAEGGGEGEASLEESMEGEVVEGEDAVLDDSEMDDAEAKALAELKAREEKARFEAETRQARINERLEISRKYQAANAQKEALVAANAELQRKLAAHLAAKRSEEAAAATAPEESAEVSQGDMETRYFQSLRQVADNRAELEKVQLSYDHMALDMKTRLEQKQDKVRELKETYSDVKTAVAIGTSAGSTGRLIPAKLLKQLEEQAGEKEVELEKVRLRNIHLRNQLRKLEGNLRRKEELSNELHLIDFEQLKIENQTLNEKIEERNEELLKLRKKTTTTVQVLTHLKEKLQFVQAENQLLKVELAQLEAELSTHRDALTRAKHDRDSLRSENLRLRGEAGLIGTFPPACPFVPLLFPSPPLPCLVAPPPFLPLSFLFPFPLFVPRCARAVCLSLPPLNNTLAITIVDGIQKKTHRNVSRQQRPPPRFRPAQKGHCFDAVDTGGAQRAPPHIASADCRFVCQGYHPILATVNPKSIKYPINRNKTNNKCASYDYLKRTK